MYGPRAEGQSIIPHPIKITTTAVNLDLFTAAVSRSYWLAAVSRHAGTSTKNAWTDVGPHLVCRSVGNIFEFKTRFWYAFDDPISTDIVRMPPECFQPDALFPRKLCVERRKSIRLFYRSPLVSFPRKRPARSQPTYAVHSTSFEITTSKTSHSIAIVMQF